ncbi:unnamed protein product, partial [Rotaria magnacalcarata]
MSDNNKIMVMSALKDLNIQRTIYSQGGIIYNNETSVIQTLQYYHPIIHVQLNQLINYFDPRPEYIRAIIIEWSTKSSISVARIISADIQCSLLSARRYGNFDDYSQQVDRFKLS